MFKKVSLSIAFVAGMFVIASAQNASTSVTATSDKPATEAKQGCAKAEGKACCSKSTSSAEMKSHCSEGSKASASTTEAATTNERKSKKATASNK